MRHIIPQKNIRKSINPLKDGRSLKLFKKTLPRARRALIVEDYYSPHRRRKVPKSLFVILGLIAFFLIVQSFFQLPLFRIDKVSIKGLKYLPATEVEYYIRNELARRRWIIFHNNNYFLVALDRMKQRLENKFYLNVVKLDKHLPNALYLDVEERIAAFVLQTPERYIGIDSTGKWIGEVPGPSGSQKVIADERKIIGTAIPIEYLEKITIIRDNWEQLIPPEIILDKFHLIDDSSKIIASTDKNIKIYFSPTKDILPQLSRLAVYLQETSLNEPQEYIDLRFDESLYVK